MNIKIDTTNKIITIEDSLVSFSELIAELDKLIPNWKEYKLQGVRSEYSFIPYQPYAPAYPFVPTINPLTPYPWDGYTFCEVTFQN